MEMNEFRKHTKVTHNNSYGNITEVYTHVERRSMYSRNVTRVGFEPTRGAWKHVRRRSGKPLQHGYQILKIIREIKIDRARI